MTCRGIRDTLGLNQSPGETQAMTLFICLSVNRWIWFAKVILLVCRHLIEAGATWSVEFNAVALLIIWIFKNWMTDGDH